MTSEVVVSFTVFDKDHGTLYALALKKPSGTDIVPIEKIHENDRFSKYIVNVTMSGEMAVTMETTHAEATYVRSKKSLRTETYSEYLLRRSTVLDKNVRWAYNIINGISEQDRICFKNDSFVIIPTVGWDGKNVSKLHLLALFSDKELKTMRDLRAKHIPILRSALDEGFRVIKNVYGIDSNKIKAYFHYPPSTWLLHIHFNPIEYTTVSSSSEYAHSVHNVIENLTLIDDYYTRVTLQTSG
jgi:m7GpppX diphosphatase